MQDRDSAEFGALAVALGFLTRDQLRFMIDEQRRWREQGTPSKLGELCVAHGLLTKEQVFLVLRAQGKRVLCCPTCRKSYSISTHSNGDIHACKTCGGELVTPLEALRLTHRRKKTTQPVSGALRGTGRSTLARQLEEAPADSPPEEIRHLLPGYEIVCRLGRGGMGTVYKARDQILPRWVAVKLLSPSLADNEEYVRRFFREAKLAKALKHRNIVEAYDCGVAGDFKFFLMEFVDGDGLDRIIERRKKLPEHQALEIARQAAEGLHFAWKHRVVHRDIKPQNLMISRGVVKICDLGLSKSVVADTSLTLTGEINCSPAYASPEQGRGLKDIDCRSDVYSLGVTLFEALAGVLPFVAEGPGDFILKHAMDPRPDVREKNPEVSAWTSSLLRKMMAINPDDRPSPKAVAKGIRVRLATRKTQAEMPRRPTP